MNDKKKLWWNLRDIPEFVAMIATEGGDNLRMEVTPGADGNKLELLDVETGEPCGSYNFSHTCPPDCA